MTDDPWAAFRSPKETSDDPWASFRSKPAEPQTPEQATDAMSAPDKFTRAGVKSLTSGASGLVNTLGKSIEGADPKKLAKLQSLIGAIEERMGVDPSQYKPASEVTGDSTRPLSERLQNFPRSVVEMAGPALVGGAVGGLPGAVALTTASTAGPTIDRKREALGLTPDQALPDKAKKEVAAKLGLDAALLAGGGAFTRNLMGPIESTGVKAFGEASKRAAQATLVDAGLGMDAAASDKVLVEGKFPTASDLVVGAAQGGLPGLVAHAPGVAGRVPGAVGEVGATAGKAVREPFVNRAFKPMEALEPESRGRVADRVSDFGNKFDAAQDTLLKDVSNASKGLDDVTKENINNITTAFEHKTPVKPEWVDQVTQADPVAGRTVQDLITLGSMRSLEDKALSKSTKGLNPFESFKTRVGDYALAHLFSSKLAAALATAQTGIDLGARGIDRFTGLADPASEITRRYAGTASPTPSVAEARQAAFDRGLDFRNTAKLDAANRKLDQATLEQKKLEFRKVAKADVKSKEAESKRMMAEAAASVRALNKRDDLQSKYESGVSADQRKALANDKWRLGVMSRSDIPMSEALGRDLGYNQNVPLQELVSSDARPSLKAQAGIQRILNASDKAMQERLAGEKRRLELMANSEGASASDASLALKVAKLRQNESAALNPEEQGPPEFDWGSSSSLAGTDTAKNMALAKVLERHNAKVDRQNKAAEKANSDTAQAKAAGKVKQAKEKVEQAKADTESDMHSFEHRGMRVEVEKKKIGDIKAYERKTRRNIDDRMEVIDRAKSKTKDSNAHKLLDQLAKDWTTRASNDPKKAYSMMEDVANDENISSDVANYLMDKWGSIKETWR